MIVGTGVAIVDVQRFGRSLLRFGERWHKRVFCDDEWEYAVGAARAERLAVRFAAKCAGLRALQIASGSLCEIEVVRADSGRPSLKFHGQLQIRANELQVARIHVTLSHEGPVGVAFLILEGEGDA